MSSEQSKSEDETRELVTSDIKKNQKLFRSGDLLKISLTKEELDFREAEAKKLKNYPELVRCTKCLKTLNSGQSKKHGCFEHPVLGVLMCGKCLQFYGNEEFSLDEDGEDKYCRWCGEGGRICLCSKCICGFCLKCIKKNFDREKVQEVKDDDGWLCFLCSPKSLWKLRYICHLTIEKKEKGEVDQRKSFVNQDVNTLKQGEVNGTSNSDRTSKRIGKRKRESCDLALFSETSSDANIIKSPIRKRIRRHSKPKVNTRRRLAQKRKRANSIETVDSDTSKNSDILFSSSSDEETLNDGKNIPESSKKLLNKFLDILKVGETTSALCRNIFRKKIRKMSSGRYLSNEQLLQECEKAKSAIILISSSMSTAHNLLISLQQKCGRPEVNQDITFLANDFLLNAMGTYMLKGRIKKSHVAEIMNDVIRRYPYLEAATKSFCDQFRDGIDETMEAFNLRNISYQTEEAKSCSDDESHAEVDSDENGNSASTFWKALKLIPVKSKDKTTSQKRKPSSPSTSPSDASTEILLSQSDPSGMKVTSKGVNSNTNNLSNECSSGLLACKRRASCESNSSGRSKNWLETVNANSCKLKEQLLKTSSESSSSKEKESDTSEYSSENEGGRGDKGQTLACRSSKIKRNFPRSAEERQLDFLTNLKSLDRNTSRTSKRRIGDVHIVPVIKKSLSERKEKKMSESDVDDVTSTDYQTEAASLREFLSVGSAFEFVKKSSTLKNFVLATSDSSEGDREESGPDSDSSQSKATSTKKEKGESENSKSNSIKERRNRQNSSTISDSSVSDTDGSGIVTRTRRTRWARVLESTEESDSASEVECLSTTTYSSPGKRRKNIKKILKKGDLQLETRQAEEVEKERKKRMTDKNAVYNVLFPSEDERLVLDFDMETKEVLLEVPQHLAKKLKPHQKKGVKFMWDCCFDSVDKLEESSGSGCILAHCMGLGKTLQVITLVYTIMRRDIGVKTVLIVCPLNVANNWLNEFDRWLKNADFGIDVYNGNNSKRERLCNIRNWQEYGGVLIISYDMMRNLTKTDREDKTYIKCLQDPGPDMVVCDEGHLLKNENTSLFKCMQRMKTSRRVVLTGTPFQNNLLEYHSMIQFIKPNILGTKKEFMNRFGNPIKNGQFEDSTVEDVKLMRARSHVLHKLLDGCIQRFDYSVLTPFLPEKHEYAISIRLTETQSKLYEYYLKKCCNPSSVTPRGTKLFADFHWLRKIWTHPKTMEPSEETFESRKGNASGSGGYFQSLDEPEITVLDEVTNSALAELDTEDYWKRVVRPSELEDVESSGKLVFLFDILEQCREVGDKVLVFSQSLVNLSLIESFLQKVDSGNAWVRGRDYFRMDGSTSSEIRSKYCKKFNSIGNKRARLFLISTKAGGLGINLVAANRVVIFDVSWNPSHDVQSIFRVYRFGQKKPCYIYRLLSDGTMEEKIYARQVTKLSLEKRVLDQHQIERHYTMGNLLELYRYDPTPQTKWCLPNVPKDKVLAEILKSRRELIVKYHEHDSLLENKEEEELTEEERRAAWEDFEKERQQATADYSNTSNLFPTRNVPTPQPVQGIQLTQPIQPMYVMRGMRPTGPLQAVQATRPSFSLITTYPGRQYPQRNIPSALRFLLPSPMYRKS